jgi:hypothetical protein
VIETVEIPQKDDGRFKERTLIRASPTQAGDYVQTKVFSCPDFTGNGDKIPSRILFEMHLGPATPSVDVNVNPH